jgi:hypothetical protein
VDRARRGGAARARGRAGAAAIRGPGRRLTIRLAAPLGACALAALAWGCKGVTADANAPVAIEFLTPQAPPVQLEELDTIVIGVRVRNQSGDTIPGAPIQLVALPTDTFPTVGVDTALHYGLVGLRAGPGRVIAISGSLQSDPLGVSVSAAADSLALVGAAVDTVLAAASVSGPLAVALLDYHSTRGDTVRLSSPPRPVTFTIAYPVFASLAAATVTLGNDSLSSVVLTGSGTPAGAASVVVRPQGAPRPDSVVVEATAMRANGTVVPGSPARFVVYFQ